MDPITLAIIAAGVVTVAGVRHYLDLRKKNASLAREKDKLSEAIKGYTLTYSFEGPDEDLISKCRHYLEQRFGGNYDQVFAQYTFLEERKRFALQIAWELAEQMDIQVDSIDFSENMIPNNGGYVDPRGGRLKVVLNPLLLDDPKSLISVMCHEFRHCVQYNSISDNKKGYSNERIAQWIYSLNNYVAVEYMEDMAGYESQIAEVDANNFAEAVMGE